MVTLRPIMAQPRRLLRLLVAGAVISTLLATSPAVGTPFGPGSPEGPAKDDRITRDFFGMDIGVATQGPTAWPALNLDVIRLGISWRDIERIPGRYDWTGFDAQVASAAAHGVRPLVIIHFTPHFHAVGSAEPTSGSAPRLSAYRNFARALVTRYGKQVDYQVWNEANVQVFFTGTPKQMAAMTKILGKAVQDLAPAATVVAPAFPLRGEEPTFRAWFRTYWKQVLGKHERPVGDFVDAASISAYPMWDEDPEDGLALTQWARKLLANRGFDGPLWVTEINYGASGGPPTLTPIPMERQVAFVVRTFVVHATNGADRMYWWNWEGDRTVNTHLNDGTGGLTAAGTAFGVVQDWLLGTKPLGCTVTTGVTACGFRPTNGADRYVYWTRSGKTRRIAIPEGAKKQTDPAGNTTTLKPGNRLKVGLTPIMVKVRSR